MGYTTIYILIESSLFGGTVPTISSSASANDTIFQFTTIPHTTSADTSLIELMGFIFSNIKHTSTASTDTDGNNLTTLDWKLSIFDISYHPAKIITPLVTEYTQVTGTKSKTLQSMGWYPSGKLVVLPHPAVNGESEEHLLNKFLEWQSRNVLQHEEFAYNDGGVTKRRIADNNNHTAAAASSSTGVQWTGAGAASSSLQNTALIKPSEIFTAVEQRSDAEILQEQHAREQAIASGIDRPKKKKKRTEKERAQRLDTLLQNLDDKSSGKKKKKAVSAQVRKMLLKQKSEGNKKLRMEDRFHLEIVCLWDVPNNEVESTGKPKKESGSRSYKFFSRQSTVGRVASSIAGTLGTDVSSEFLVSYPPPARGENQEQGGGEKRYRRLFNTMSLHDASNAGYVNEFDVVVVRIYSLNCSSSEDEEFGPSKSVSDPDSDEEMDNNEVENEGNGSQETGRDAESKSTALEVDSGGNKATDTVASQPQVQQYQEQIQQQRIHTIFQLAGESNSSNPAKKKKKPVSKQVQSMLMKSKATGNKSIKQEDRVYLNVMVYEDKGHATCGNDVSSSYRYFSTQNDIQHIITVLNKASSDNAGAELIVQRPTADSTDAEGMYHVLPNTLSLGDAIQKGYVENFGRVLIRLCSL